MTVSGASAGTVLPLGTLRISRAGPLPLRAAASVIAMDSYPPAATSAASRSPDRNSSK
jgi:hypothetical protein